MTTVRFIALFLTGFIVCWACLVALGIVKKPRSVSDSAESAVA